MEQEHWGCKDQIDDLGRALTKSEARVEELEAKLAEEKKRADNATNRADYAENQEAIYRDNKNAAESKLYAAHDKVEEQAKEIEMLKRSLDVAVARLTLLGEGW